MFNGFPEETIRFFLDLRFHNDAAFFNENRERYRQDVQAPFYEFIEELAPIMQSIDPLMEVRPYKCLARIRRDTRFTKDKSPYRDHLWLCFRRMAEPRYESLNYFFEFGPDSFGWGLGFWGENRRAMDMFRRQMAAQPLRIQDIIDDCNLPERQLVLGGSNFKRMSVPENIPPLLKPWYTTKELYVARFAPEYRWAYQPELVDIVRDDFLALAPLYRYFRGICDDMQDRQDV